MLLVAASRDRDEFETAEYIDLRSEFTTGAFADPAESYFTKVATFVKLSLTDQVRT